MEKPRLIKDLGMQYATEKSKYKYHFALFECQMPGCGKFFKADISAIKTGNTKSCGCYDKLRRHETRRIHGMWGTRIYNQWKGIKSRCYNSNDTCYENYGGDGVIVCDEWRNDFMAFYNWSMDNGYSDILTINRIGCSKIYSSKTCNWADRPEQAQDTRLIRSTNKSGFRGVSWHNGTKKWTATICVESRRKYLGVFNTTIEAARAYNDFVIANGTHHPLNPL